uniref:RE72727p n=1 Tax=Drosophila melanogaster TaxID=7227 RepID=B3LF79_DROME|nr:RE72727p [Drosophila melanogaster]
MDIPASGAIFTLGKSHLAENTQSYFYIKNDPVKRLISGPNQSAVICESGRLFVWGENHYGQLGIDGHGGASGKKGGGSHNGNGDIVTKPTCVKALKTIGLKICDVAFGNHWAVMLTHSNEIFFTGRNIFPEDTHVAQHFTSAQVDQQPCAIIRKPFRLEEFDDYLSKNEETDNFMTVQAGKEHFAVLTTTGRLIGCGSNAQLQLGELEADYDGHPVEIRLDAPVQQFTCGPESTLVLTATGNLFLTGHLNEFVFPRFTELQKNLPPTEAIIFMHISKTSEVYIVTNAGSIYRSFESLRNKSLVFQRFYDYDCEENGPIWKLLKGFSFYAVLSKANKFFTTFSESGHHLKTFREISKFKNLRLLDIAVGDQHVLVQGIPRSSMSSASVNGSAEPNRYVNRSFVLQPTDANGNKEDTRTHSGRSLIKQEGMEETEDLSMSTTVGELAAAAGAGTAAAMEAVKHLINGEKPEEKSDLTRYQDLNANIESADIIPKEHKEAKGSDEIGPNSNISEKEEDNQIADRVTPGNKNESAADQEKSVHSPNTAATSEAIKTNDGYKEMKPSATIESPVITADTKESSLKPIVSPVKTKRSPAKTIESSIKSSSSPVKPTESMQKLPTPPTHTPTPPNSPTESLRSNKSAHDMELVDPKPKVPGSQETLLRPRTPYPESSNSSTPQTIKKTPIRNFSYESAMDHDHLERTSPELVSSLDTVEEVPTAKIHVNTPTPPTEDDEHLAVEITTTKDSTDSSKVINEIRFINDGVDVTSRVEEQMPDTPLESSVEDLESDGEQKMQRGEEQVDKIVTSSEEAVSKVGEDAIDVMDSTRNSIQTAVKNAANGARDAMEAVGERMATGARGAVDTVGGAVGAAGKGAHRLASDAMHAVEQVGSSAMHAVEQAGSNAVKAASETKDSMGRAMDSVTSKISTEVLGAKENISSLFQIKAAREADPQTTPCSTPRGEDDLSFKEGAPKTTTTLGSNEEDERTTASVNSNHNSAGHGNGNGNIFEPSTTFEDPLDAVVERSKKAMQDDIRAMQLRANSHIQAVAQQKEEDAKGFVKQVMDRLSCRNEKAVRIEDELRPPAGSHNKNTNKVNSELSLTNGQAHGDQSQASRVCTIL